jgi:hypothetical protein
VQCDGRRSHAILDATAEGGIDFIDTANVYPLGGNQTTKGRTEGIVGNGLPGARRRCRTLIPSPLRSIRGASTLAGGMVTTSQMRLALQMLHG